MRILLIGALLLPACSTTPATKNPSAPALIHVLVDTYAPIDSALTRRCNWIRAGKPSAVFEVSNGRKRCLGQYEVRLDAIGDVQENPLP